MISAWNAAMAWLDAVPTVWFVLGAAALYAALSMRRAR